MIFRIYFILFFGFQLSLICQTDHLFIYEKTHRYGIIKNINLLESNFILENRGVKKILLLKAESKKGLKVWASKKCLLPGDTATVKAQMQALKKGRFSFKIKLFTGESDKAKILRMKGYISSIKAEDKTACFYFNERKKRKRSNYKYEIIIVSHNQNKISAIDTSIFENIKIYETDTLKLLVPDTSTKQKTTKSFHTLLPIEKYKPNNIIFLIDVSGSMADTTKLRWLKISINNLLNNLRPTDKISLLCYRDSVNCIADGLSYEKKYELINIVDALKARGNTKGNKAIKTAIDLCIKNYISDGNNQIILASDGVFPFNNKDYSDWTQKTANYKINLSTLAFGKDLRAMENLKSISKKGEGSFIQVTSRKFAEKAVFNEIEMRSRK